MGEVKKLPDDNKITEITTEVRVFKVESLCSCKGYMRPTGATKDKNYQHKCTDCGKTAYYPQAYPALIYRDIVQPPPQPPKKKNKVILSKEDIN